MAVIQVWVGGTRRSTVKQTNVPDRWRRCWVCGAHRYTEQAWTHCSPHHSTPSITSVSLLYLAQSNRAAAVVCRRFLSEGWRTAQTETGAGLTRRLTSAPAACGAPAVWEHCFPGRCSATGPSDSWPLPAAPPAPRGILRPHTSSLKRKKTVE